jgi:hypothetical protein
MCKDHGGVGILNLRDLNMSLLGSWISRYQKDDGKLWKQIIDEKYKTTKSNFMYTPTKGGSHFLKGVMWAAKAANLGIRWKIGDGKKVKFWEDNWLGTSSLAIQFWNLYAILNEKNKPVADLWDGSSLKCTFRRIVDETLMRDWDEVVQLASTIIFSDSQDEIIWTFKSNGKYSSQALYRIINFRGVKPVHTPAIWEIKIPPRVHFFLWLLTQNKVLTRDNVSKRKHVEDSSCLFCCERETVHHLFFDCVVAKQMWLEIAECVDQNIGSCFESIGKLWLSNKKFVVTNIITSAALWGLWKLRNSFCFQVAQWRDVNFLLQKITGLVHKWKLLCPGQHSMELEMRLNRLQDAAKKFGRLTA